MSKGILLYARNNLQIDYVKQAYFLAIQAKKILNLPTTVVTDSFNYLEQNFPNYNKIFDKVIKVVWNDTDIALNTVLSRYENHSSRTYKDGALYSKKLQFKNQLRSTAYDISPYDETILLDTDYLILNKNLEVCFSQSNDFLIYDDAYDLCTFRDHTEFSYLSDAGIKFYWATAVFFRKTNENKIFFDLLQHIQDNWQHYRSMYQIKTTIFRNDHLFSIAIHIMNGYKKGTFARPLPGKLFYTSDRDICWQIRNNSVIFLLQKENYNGEYTLVNWKEHNIHVMNKFSLNRCIDEYLHE